MEQFKPLLIYFFLPFVVVSLLYFLFDREGNRTMSLFKKPEKMSQKLYDGLIKQRLSIQFLLTLIVVLIMTVLGVELEMKLWLFYLLCGVLVGLINSVGLAVSRNISRKK